MTLGEIAGALSLKFTGDGEVEIRRAAPLESAGAGDIAFVRDKKAARNLQNCKASALILPPGVEPDRPAIIAENPLIAMSMVVDMIDPEPRPSPGVHPTAVIGEGAGLGDDVHIGPCVTVGARARIGARASIRAGARIGGGAVVGPDTVIFENVVVYERCEIGAGCRIHANSTIGADGFGYTRGKDGRNVKIPQRGIVRIEDDVEVGANSSIDRAALGVTLIRRGVKIDNQVQIGHNTAVGENTVIAGCSGIAGSVVIGANVMIGGMAAVSDHVTITDGAVIAGKTGVHSDITEPGVYAGPMAMRNMEYKRFILSGRVIDGLRKRIKMIEERLGLKGEKE